MSGVFPAAEPLDPVRWLLLPTFLCLAATVALALPLRLWGVQLPEPIFPLIPAFAWALIRPSILPPLLLLLMGLFLDLFWGGPLGLWGVASLAAYGVVLAGRPLMMGQSQPVLWGWYAVAVVAAFATAFLLVMLDARVTPNLLAVLLQAAPTVLLFPLAARLLRQFEDADVRFR